MQNLAHMISQSVLKNGKSKDKILFETASITPPYPSGLPLQ